jgi:hypothetical protein
MAETGELLRRKPERNRKFARAGEIVSATSCGQMMNKLGWKRILSLESVSNCVEEF